MHSEPESVRFELNSNAVMVDTTALGKMKRALHAFVESAKFPTQFAELREPLLAELKDSAPWIDRETAGIGLWRLEKQGAHLTLVHYPPPGDGPAYIYHATLAQNNYEWTVTVFEQEHEFGPM